QGDRAVIPLSRFHAEKGAEFELILGLARPLPGMEEALPPEGSDAALPQLRLSNDRGEPLETPSLELDRGVSTPRILVYRFRPELGEGSWYRASLRLSEANLRGLDESIPFTFSVGSLRPNVQIQATLVQQAADPDQVLPPADRGMIRGSDQTITIEAQVYAGASVLGASVRGML